MNYYTNSAVGTAISDKYETGFTATNTYAVGDLFMLNGALYVATSAIDYGDAIWYEGANANCVKTTIVGEFPRDIQVNGTSVVSNGVANIPVASTSDAGVVKVSLNNGTQMINGVITTVNASDAEIKAGLSGYKMLSATKQHQATFYGLAKAAGDTTQAASDNAIGTYTADAKAAIQTMIGLTPAQLAAASYTNYIETVSGTTPTITGQPNMRYLCGEVSTISITPPAAGSISVRFESGSTVAVLTVPNTVIWPEWFDATSLETDTIYEIMIEDGIYGMVMSWPA